MIAKILNLNSFVPENVCAIDASTNSIAFAIFKNSQLQASGKLNFNGKNIYEKVKDAALKTKDFFNLYKINAVVIEHTVFINSPKTAADLALVQGAILGALWNCGVTDVGSVSPITWQSYIGNKKMTKEERLLLKSKNPGKSDSWLKSYERSLRKQKTINFVNINYDRALEDNDVADSIAIGHWAIHNWGKLTR